MFWIIWNFFLRALCGRCFRLLVSLVSISRWPSTQLRYFVTVVSISIPLSLPFSSLILLFVLNAIAVIMIILEHVEIIIRPVLCISLVIAFISYRNSRIRCFNRSYFHWDRSFKIHWTIHQVGFNCGPIRFQHGFNQFQDWVYFTIQPSELQSIQNNSKFKTTKGMERGKTVQRIQDYFIWLVQLLVWIPPLPHRMHLLHPPWRSVLPLFLLLPLLLPILIQILFSLLLLFPLFISFFNLFLPLWVKLILV